MSLVSLPTPANLDATHASPKPPGYFSCTRPELVALVPAHALRILDIGCGAGQLAGALRSSRPSAKLEIVGIEVSATAAKQAMATVDTVIVGNVEQMNLDFQNFDCIILGDVLEHLIDPWMTLRRIANLVSNSGVVIASIPNIQHWRVIIDLIRGRWDYREFGIMDSTHLRFFTKRTIHRLFATNGLAVSSITPLLTTTKAKMAYRATAGLAGSFLAHQYLVVARPVVSAQILT